MKRSISMAVASLGFIAILVAVTVQAPSGGREDPIPSFNFAVEIEGVVVGSFKEVSGLKCETEVVEYREGTDPNVVRLLPGISRCGPIVLEKGLTSSTELWDWYEQTLTGSVARKNGAVIMLSASHTEVARYNFYNAWPSKYEISPLNAGSSEVLIETVVLAVEMIERA